MKNLISVFLAFCLFVFSFSCGIPNYFYLGQSYVNFSLTSDGSSNTDNENYSVSISLDDSYQLSKCRDCPSVFLFYMLDSDDYYRIATNESDINSRFNETYGAWSRKGSLINVKKGEATPIIQLFTPSSYEDKKVSIYNFSFKGGKEVTRPSYHLPISIDSDHIPNENVIDFVLSFEKQSKKLTLMSGFDNATGEYRVKEELVRAEGLPFADIITTDDFKTYAINHIDCLAIDPNNLTSIKLNVMCAVCASDGSFDNIYWTGLKKIASFSL